MFISKSKNAEKNDDFTHTQKKVNSTLNIVKHSFKILLSANEGSLAALHNSIIDLISETGILFLKEEKERMKRNLVRMISISILR